MISRNTAKAILMMMYISTARRITCLIFRITPFWNKYEKANTFTFSPAAALMKTHLPAENLPGYFMIKEFGMNWMCGGRNGRMTGIPGGLCCPIISDQDF